MFKNSKFVQLNEKIKEAESDSELNSMVNLYNKIYKAEEVYCSCELATQHIKNYNIFRPYFSKTIYLLKLQQDYNDESCLRFRFLNKDFFNGVMGIKEASKLFFNKSLKEITQEQEIYLLVIFENPSLYDPNRRKEMISKKVKKYQNLLKQNGS